MNKLFSFITKNESHIILRIAAKVFRVFHIVLAFALAFYFILYGIKFGDFGVFLLYLFLGIFAFCFSMFIGIFIETLILGLANIVENQYEELVLKNKAENKKEEFYLKKKQKASFEMLEKLNDLRMKEAITEEEYEAKKKEFLEKM